jgi:tRNA-splicing endonuclease subunit Sen2
MPTIDHKAKITYKRGKRRVAEKQPSPEQCLDWLASSNLHGVLCRNAVWLACTRQLAYFLERVCLGRRAPSPEAATGVPVFFNVLGSPGARADDAANPVLVRLSPEEAFYMVHHMDCLTVHGVERGVPPGETESESRPEETGSRTEKNATSTWLVRLSRDELWRTLVLLGAEHRGVSNFVARCAAHAHFRKQGWLPRSGLQYGADLVLYRNHPSLVHSDFCVVLAPSRATTLASRRAVAAFRPTAVISTEFGATRARLGLRRWTEVQAASRLCVQVNKGLISASVECLETEDASTPACLRSIAVEETEIRRFNPERNKNAS